jgi:hypothetical protein
LAFLVMELTVKDPLSDEASLGVVVSYVVVGTGLGEYSVRPASAEEEEAAAAIKTAAAEDDDGVTEIIVTQLVLVLPPPPGAVVLSETSS